MKSEIIQKLIDHVKSECKPIDQDAQYDAMLDECYSFASVGGIFATMQPSRVLAEMDPTAYRCGKNDYFGTSGDNYEIDGELYEQRPVDDARQEFTEELESEIDGLQAMLDDETYDDRERTEATLVGQKARLAEVEAYSF